MGAGAEEVQGELCWREQEVPPVSRESGHGFSKNGEEVVFKNVDGMFSSIAAVHMWRF